MDEWDNLGDNLFCHLKSMESWVKDENHSPLKRLQSNYSCSKFTKEGFNVQRAWHYPLKWVIHYGPRSGFPCYNMITLSHIERMPPLDNLGKHCADVWVEPREPSSIPRIISAFVKNPYIFHFCI
jgi:hypothetical protein